MWNSSCGASTPAAARVAFRRPRFRSYAQTLYKDAPATLDDLREAVTTLEDTERIARRVLGGAHPFLAEMGPALRSARALLRARETPGS